MLSFATHLIYCKFYQYNSIHHIVYVNQQRNQNYYCISLITHIFFAHHLKGFLSWGIEYHKNRKIKKNCWLKECEISEYLTSRINLKCQTDSDRYGGRLRKRGLQTIKIFSFSFVNIGELKEPCMLMNDRT